MSGLEAATHEALSGTRPQRAARLQPASTAAAGKSESEMLLSPSQAGITAKSSNAEGILRMIQSAIESKMAQRVLSRFFPGSTKHVAFHELRTGVFYEHVMIGGLPMSTLRSSRALCAAATLLLACGAQSRVAVIVSPPAPPTPQAAASTPAPPELHPPQAHYVAREPAADATGLKRRRALGVLKLYGPATTNEALEYNVRLAPGSIGLLDLGHRYTFQKNQLAAADDSGAQGRLVGFVQVPDAFGGGFVFYEEHTAYFAKTFAGSLVRLGDHPMSDFDIGPRCILIRDGHGHGWLFGLDDAKPIAKAPSDLEHFMAHLSGFMVGASDKLSHVYFAQKAGSWRELAIKKMVDGLVEEDDILVSDAHDNVYRVRRDGRIVAAKKDAMSDAESRARAAAISAMGLTENDEEAEKTEAPAPPLTAVPTEAALLAGGWSPSMQAEDEWFGVHQDRVYIARTRTGEIRTLGPVLQSGEELCEGRVLSGWPLLVCGILGTRLRVFRIDLDTGKRSLENEVNVTQGMARQIGRAQGYYPETVFITASCEGDARGGVCVRGSDGHYSTYELPGSDRGNSYIFPGEVIQSKDDGREGLGLSRLSNGKVYAFDATAMKEVNTTLRWDAEARSGKKFPPFIESGALLTRSSLRLFYIPDPRHPLPPLPASYAIDLPLDGSGKVRLLRASGVVVATGAHGLRLDAGKLYETNDGWTTWYEVASPPSGAPENLAAATCDDRGCLFGPWARIGWQRPNGLPEPVAPLLEPVAPKKTTSGAKP
jgi:hypothetical protein